MGKSRFFNNNLTDRHMAITDGVFAIAMTILVLEIAVPTLSDINSGLIITEYMLNYLVPAIIIYFISFYLVVNFWETTNIIFSFRKISNNVLFLNMFALAAVCLIPFATGFLFNFYSYFEVNIFFSLLILCVSLIYLLIIIMVIRDNFSEIFDNHDEIRGKYNNKLSEGFVFPNFKLYLRGALLTVIYLILSPIIISVISIILAFISPSWCILSFILVLIIRLLIRIKKVGKSSQETTLTDSEREFLKEIEESIY
jgi:uncharacterized membrane protein